MNREEIQVINRALGVRMKEMRTAKGMSLEQLAKKIGLGPAAISRIEDGAINIGYVQWIEICQGLEVLPKDFMKFEFLGPAQPMEEGEEEKGEGPITRFLNGLGAIGALSKATRGAVKREVQVKMMRKWDEWVQGKQGGNELVFVSEGTLLITKATTMNIVYTGFLTEGSFFFDADSFNSAKDSNYSLRPLSDLTVHMLDRESLTRLGGTYKALSRFFSVERFRDVGDLEAKRSIILKLTRKQRIQSMNTYFPLWSREVPAKMLATYLEMSISYYRVNQSK